MSMGKVNIEGTNEMHHLGLARFKTEMGNSSTHKVNYPLLSESARINVC